MFSPVGTAVLVRIDGKNKKALVLTANRLERAETLAAIHRGIEQMDRGEKLTYFGLDGALPGC